MKGRIVVADAPFQQGEYICTYDGELLSAEEGEKRDMQYDETPDSGSFLFFFPLEGKQYWYVNALWTIFCEIMSSTIIEISKYLSKYQHQ